MNPAVFVNQLVTQTSPATDKEWSSIWDQQETTASEFINEFLGHQEFNELQAVQEVASLAVDRHLAFGQQQSGTLG